jgi:hypothetical protein
MHMAQNVRFHEAIIADFVDYYNRQIVAGRYGAVSMSGVKLPAYIIFKGVRGGRVWAKV